MKASVVFIQFLIICNCQQSLIGSCVPDTLQIDSAGYDDVSDDVADDEIDVVTDNSDDKEVQQNIN